MSILRAGVKSHVSLYHSLAYYLTYEILKNVCHVEVFSVLQLTYLEYLQCAKSYAKHYVIQINFPLWSQQKSIKENFLNYRP